MLDIKFIRENPDLVREVIKNRQKDPSLVDLVLELDEKRRVILRELEELRRKRNEISHIAQESVIEGKSVKERIKELEPKADQAEKEFYENLILVPNLYLDDVPLGKDESENVVVRSWGQVRKFTFTPKDHLEIGEKHGSIDVERAALISGSRFAYLKGDLALMQFALISFVLKTLTDAKIVSEVSRKIDPKLSPKSFIPVIPPAMIKPDIYIKMARLDKFQAEERYFLPKDNLYLIGSSEHTLGPLHLEQTLQEEELPIRYVGYSTCFREEAGTYGKDLKGILRVHQFDKVEMESFCLPELSLKEQDFFVAIQEYIMQALGIPYRIVMICTGDLGGPDARQIDLESFMPGQNKYRETHTADLMTDYQARRLGTKVRRHNGSSQLVHMNDATACALGRTLIAILENYQNEDGSITVPEVLRPYLGKDKITP